MDIPGAMFLCSLTIFLLCSLGSLAEAMTDLGAMGGDHSEATAINSAGQVVGYFSSGRYNHAFLYDHGTMTDIGTLPGGDSSAATAINSAGQVVGNSDYGSGHWCAFLYKSGYIQDLRYTGGHLGSAAGINRSGQVAGLDYTPYEHAFIYRAGNMTDLGTLGGKRSYAAGINDAGQVAGYSDTPSGDRHAFLYNNGNMTDLGTLGGNNSYATGINKWGQVAGYSETSSGNHHAFLYNNGTMTDLGTLGGGNSTATGVNESLQVVGYSDTPSGNTRAFLYRDGHMIDLGTLGGENSYATGINDAGQVVGGAETSSGATHAFLSESPSFLTVTKAGNGFGAVTSSPAGISCGSACFACFAPGDSITLTAVPEIGSRFTKWSGGKCTGKGACTIKMPADDVAVEATFTHTTYVLTATRTGTGSGTLSATGLTCVGTSCSGTYDCDTPVTITAEAGAGSTFTGWTGCDSTSGNSCKVTMTGNKSVNADFTLNTFTLTATKTGTGSGTLSATGLTCNGATCTGKYPYNSSVTITAAPATGSTFGAWTGCATSSGTACTVTMSVARSVSASFTSNAYTLTATRTGAGTGTLSATGLTCNGATCTGAYPYNTSVTITAAPATGSTLGTWTGCDSSSGTTCTVTMSAARSVSASFTSNTYTLTATRTGTGTGTLSATGLTCNGATCTGTYPYNTSVTITAAPATGSTFGTWTGCDSSSGNSCKVTMSAARSVSASFVVRTYAVSASAPGGHGSVSPGVQTVNYGASSAVTIVPDKGYHIDSITDNGRSAAIANPYVINNVVADHVIAVTFGTTYTLSLQPGGGGVGTVTSSPKGINCGSTCTYDFKSGTKVTLTAKPVGNAAFTGWSGGGCQGTGACTVTMLNDTNVTAGFAPPATITIDPTGQGDGTVTSSPTGINCGSTCSAAFKMNSRVTLTARPGANSYFTGWTGPCSAGKTTCTITVAGATTIGANFSSDPKISVTPSSKDFGKVSLNKRKNQTFTVKNVGKGTLSPSSINITGSPFFTMSANGCGNADLKPNKTCTFTIVFKPLNPAPAPGAVSISSNDPATPVFIIPVAGNAGGTGSAPEEDAPDS